MLYPVHDVLLNVILEHRQKPIYNKNTLVRFVRVENAEVGVVWKNFRAQILVRCEVLLEDFMGQLL